MKIKSYPPLLLSTLVITVLALAWGVLRLFIFREAILPLTFVLPLMACIWTRRRWQLWGMVSLFVLMAAAKVFWLLPEQDLSVSEDWVFFASTFFNIAIGGVIIHAVLLLRDNLDARTITVTAQNGELEAQSEELSQQNEEIKAQSEELAQQNEEIESQAEELGRQNEELQETNQRLGNREEVLQSILQAARTEGGAQNVLDEVCRRALSILGRPAQAVAVLEVNQADGTFQRHAEAVDAGTDSLPQTWPLAGSLPSIVIQQNQTAYVDDVRERPDLAAPFNSNSAIRSVLATPVRVRGSVDGVVVACSTNPAHWTQEQFRVLEWIAAQCGLILESLRWQNALASRADEIAAANQAKDRFLAMLSHELRTPLTPVLAAAGALEFDSRIPTDARADLAMIRRNVAVQSRLIDDLLDVTRIERGKLDLDRRAIDVQKVLQESAAIVAGDLDARDQSLALELNLPTDCAVMGDAARLQQVFWNLLKNAIKFSPSHGRITLFARVMPDHERRISIEVRDEGAGIDPADIDRIFHPFEQAVQNRHHADGAGAGLGLGLAIAKAIVVMHHGSIRVYSAGIGKGSTFIVELPLSDAPISRPPASKSPAHNRPPVSGTNAVRILLVEDHEDTGRIIARLLKSAGYRVEHAQNVNDAVRMFEASSFDLVISDIGLPDGSGLDLMRQLHSANPQVAGICLSGFGMESDVQASMDAGFHEHLTKPIDMQRLHAAIDRATNRHMQSAPG